MYLERKFYPYREQRGFLLPLAIFIIVVMGALALTISRTSMQTQTSSIQELINVQAFYAAESGAQRGMQALFLANANRQTTDNTCTNLAINHNFAGVNGLQACVAQVACQCLYRNGSACNASNGANYLAAAAVGVTASTYTLTSTATCGTGEYSSVRTIQVGAFLE